MSNLFNPRLIIKVIFQIENVEKTVLAVSLGQKAREKI